MKRLLLILNILLSGFLFAQTGLSSTENYIYEKNCLTEDCTKKAENVKYYDGLGRLIQNISVKVTPSGKDVVVPVEYDSYGRNLKSYLPIPQPASSNGAIYTNPLGNVSATYGAEKIYSENIPEASPLGRPLSQKQVGNAWNTKPINFSYASNVLNEVKKYTVTTSWAEGRTINTMGLSGTYPANTLYKSTVTDEDGNVTIEFKNKNGQTILVRKKEDSKDVDTYYIYNKYDQLVYTIPPLAAQSGLVDLTTLDNLCYQYRYDYLNRLVEKKLPGKGWEYMVYDKQDRLVMTQDANLGASKQWIFTKYDQFGRVAYTGIYTSSQSYSPAGRAAEQALVDAKGSNNVTRTSSVGFTVNGRGVYYDNNASTSYPNSITSLLSINYYDTYASYSFNPTFPADILGTPVITDNATANAISTKGLPVMKLVKNIEDDNWTANYIYYDSKGRVIGAYSVNHLGGYTQTESLLDFAGITKQIITRHKRLATDTEKVITETFTYDSQNRLLVHKHKVDNNAEEILTQNTYNEISQLTNKKVGGTVASNPLQNIDYAYNIRGWITMINDPANLGNGKLFGYEIKYNNPVNAANGSARYNGNIAEIDWKTANDGVLRRYSYQYDTLSRLTKGLYSEPNASVPDNGFFNEEISYDVNGNITNLLRMSKSYFGMPQQIDALIYKYNGNRLTSVTDAQANYEGYPDTSGNIISYDSNGNMKDQKDKGILEIKYNFLDLADNVKFDYTYNPRPTSTGADYNVKTKYLYDANGTKLRKTYVYGSGKANLETNIITEYLDGFQYEDHMDVDNPTGPLTLRFVQTAEGYYNFENNKYIYTYKDHLGNVRLSYMNNGSGAAIIEENNYYPFGLKHQNYNNLPGNPAYQYQFNGNEYQSETGWSDYGARMYMADIGRWGVPDPMAESMRRLTPYNYGNNNPIYHIDPDGRLTQAFIAEILASPSGTTWTNTDGTFTSNQGKVMGYSGLAFNFRSSFTFSLGSVFGEGGGSGIVKDGDDNLSPWMRANMGPNPMALGVYAHRTMANYFRSAEFAGEWFPEEKQSIWKWDLSLRPDLYYKNKGVNAVWELKPISQFINSSLTMAGKNQAQIYADALTMLKNDKFYVGSSNGAPIPPINGRVLTDSRSGYQFSYNVPIGTDGMIYYTCMNCDSPERNVVRETKKVPQVTPKTVNQIGTGTAVMMLVLRALLFAIPN